MEDDDQSLGASAIEAAERWRDQDWEGLRSSFGDALTARLGADQLRDAWEQMNTMMGALQGIGRPSVTRRGRLAVVDVPLAYEHGAMKARATYEPDGRVCGFFVLYPEVP